MHATLAPRRAVSMASMYCSSHDRSLIGLMSPMTSRSSPSRLGQSSLAPPLRHSHGVGGGRGACRPRALEPLGGLDASRQLKVEASGEHLQQGPEKVRVVRAVLASRRTAQGGSMAAIPITPAQPSESTRSTQPPTRPEELIGSRQR